jgi:hypothetical protein
MTFEELLAGNAHGCNATRLGTSAALYQRSMPLRSLLVLALLLLVALPIPTARAADPLLSGYAGPGSGEQVVLGGGTVGGGDGSGGSGATAARRSLSAAASSSSSTSSSLSSGQTGSVTRKPRSKRSSSASRHQTSSGSSTSAASATTSQPATSPRPAGAPRVVAYPTRAGAVGSFPLSLAGALLAVVGIALLVLAGLGLRRLASGHHDGSPMPQVPVR